jgi:hypothetical protein
VPGELSKPGVNWAWLRQGMKLPSGQSQSPWDRTWTGESDGSRIAFLGMPLIYIFVASFSFRSSPEKSSLLPLLFIFQRLLLRRGRVAEAQHTQGTKSRRDFAPWHHYGRKGRGGTCRSGSARGAVCLEGRSWGGQAECGAGLSRQVSGEQERWHTCPNGAQEGGGVTEGRSQWKVPAVRERHFGTSLPQGPRLRHVHVVLGRCRSVRWLVRQLVGGPVACCWVLGSHDRRWEGHGERPAHLSYRERSRGSASRSVGFPSTLGLAPVWPGNFDMVIAWGTESFLPSPFSSPLPPPPAPRTT